MLAKTAVTAVAIIAAAAFIPSTGEAEKAGMMCTYNVPNCTAHQGYLTDCTWGHEADGKTYMIWLLYGSVCPTWVDY